MPWGEQAYYRILVPMGQQIEQYYHEYAHPWVSIAWAKVYHYYEQTAKSHVDVALAWFWRHYYTTQVFFHGQVNPRLRHSVDTTVHTYRTHVVPTVIAFYQDHAVPFYHHRVRPAAQQAAAQSVHVYYTYALPYSAHTYRESLRLAKHIHRTYVVPGSAAAYDHAHHFTTTVVAPFVHRQYRTYLGPHVDRYVDWDQVEVVHGKACTAARMSKQWMEYAATVATQYVVQGYEFNRQLWAQYVGDSKGAVLPASEITLAPELTSAPQTVNDQLTLSVIPATTLSNQATPIAAPLSTTVTAKASVKPTQPQVNTAKTTPTTLNTRSSSTFDQATPAPAHPDRAGKAQTDPMPPTTTRSLTTIATASTHQGIVPPVASEAVHVATTLPSAADGAQRVVEPSSRQTTPSPVEQTLAAIEESESLSVLTSSAPANTHSQVSSDSAQPTTAASHHNHSRPSSVSPSSSQTLTRASSSVTIVAASANLESLSTGTSLGHVANITLAADAAMTTTSQASGAKSSPIAVSAAATTSTTDLASTQSKPPAATTTTAVVSSSGSLTPTPMTQATTTESIRRLRKTVPTAAPTPLSKLHVNELKEGAARTLRKAATTTPSLNEDAVEDVKKAASEWVQQAKSSIAAQISSQNQDMSAVPDDRGGHSVSSMTTTTSSLPPASTTAAFSSSEGLTHEDSTAPSNAPVTHDEL
ncbi:hypothetical protein H4R35_006493 [Dimargaris xerosporica]|nr:hypothetical protein H4R35_006493 [Dimargaris xerosporica]